MKKALFILGVSLLLFTGFAPLDSHAFQGTPGPKWTNGHGHHLVGSGHRGRGCDMHGNRGCWRR